MGAKIVKFNVVDGSGSGVGGQALLIGDASLSTTKQGLAQALLEDGNTVISVNGVKVYDGPVADLKPMETFTTDGRRI